MIRLNFIFILLFIVACNRSTNTINITTQSYINGIISQQYESPSIQLIFFDLIADESYSILAPLDSNNTFYCPVSLTYSQPFIIKTTVPNHFFIYNSDSIKIILSDSTQILCRDKSHETYISHYHNLVDLLQSLQLELHNIKYVKDKSALDYKKYLFTIRDRFFESVENFLITKNINDKDFRHMAFLEIDYIISSYLVDYKLLNQIIFKRKIEIPANYFALVDSLVLTDTEIITYNYFSFLNRLSVLYDVQNIDGLLKIIDHIPSNVTQDILLCRSLYFLLENQDLAFANKRISKYSPLLKNQFIKDLFEEKHSAILYSLNNPEIDNAKLIDLTTNKEVVKVIDEILARNRNKIIYLKFWAPWCGPCMEEAPFAKQLFESFNTQDFALINLCVSTSQNRWRATIAERDLVGEHYLLSDEQYQQLSSLLNINGIPHYSLIDRNGVIVMKRASIPGSVIMDGLNQNLVQEIDNLINN